MTVTVMAPIQLGMFTLTSFGLEVDGDPTFEEWEGVGIFIKGANRRSGFWLVDWLTYGESRADWAERLAQAVDITGLSEKTLKNVRRVRNIAPARRRAETVDFTLHVEVAGLTPDEQEHWLAESESHGWDRRELRLNIRASKRAKVLEGQATLEGMYRVIYADPPWLYGGPSGSFTGQTSAKDHYQGMTVEQLCKLPVAAHALPDSVLFCWVTTPMLSIVWPVLEAWGFTYKTSMVWDKVAHNFGNYVSVRHEHLLICTRGSLTPDRPTPMIDSVQTVRSSQEHSAKPEEFRQIIERLYDGPYLELFGRRKVAGWDVFGNDARLWAEQKSA